MGEGGGGSSIHLPGSYHTVDAISGLSMQLLLFLVPKDVFRRILRFPPFRPLS